MLIAELFIDSKELLAPFLCKQFNYIYIEKVYILHHGLKELLSQCQKRRLEQCR